MPVTCKLCRYPEKEREREIEKERRAGPRVMAYNPGAFKEPSRYLGDARKN